MTGRSTSDPNLSDQQGRPDRNTIPLIGAQLRCTLRTIAKLCGPVGTTCRHCAGIPDPRYHIYVFAMNATFPRVTRGQPFTYDSAEKHIFRMLCWMLVGIFI